MSKSILPNHFSDLERDLDVAIDRLGSIDLPMSTLWNPATCPLEVLPYLAWAMSVDQWSSAWPESVKRRVVENSLQVHAQKGTRPAVERALSSLGVSAEFKEWFEAEPQAERGTFELIAWVNENLTPDQFGFLNESLYQQLQREVDNAKNARSHYSFKVGAKFGPNTIGVGGGVSGAGLMRRDGRTEQEPLNVATGVGVAMAGTAAGFSKFAVNPPSEATARKTGFVLGASLSAASVIYKRMEATT